MTPRALFDDRGRQSNDLIARLGLEAPREYGGDDVRVAGRRAAAMNLLSAGKRIRVRTFASSTILLYGGRESRSRPSEEDGMETSEIFREQADW